MSVKKRFFQYDQKFLLRENTYLVRKWKLKKFIK